MRKRLLTLVIVGIMLLAVACGGANYDSASTELAAATESKSSDYDSLGFTESASADSFDNGDYEAYAEPSLEDNGDVDLEGYDMSRKLIYTSYISLESKTYDDDLAAIKVLVA
jgi:ABC-type glycerol-3-phosphate transport system substrate-binding protein